MSQSVKLGVAGLGTVGCGLLTLLARHGDMLAGRAGRRIEVAAVSARARKRDRGVDISKARWAGNAVDLARDPDIDIFVELIGGEEGVAKDAIEAALAAGKHVVTANKALLAHHGPELATLAEENGVALNFEAAVAGGIPIVKTVRESLLGNEIGRVYGILNGTCNYILSRMQAEGLAFADVLADAQRLGYAEADPTFDVDGIDAAHKLALLTTLAFGTKTAFDEIYIEGIRAIEAADIEAADALGYRIKLLGVAERKEGGIEQRVHPTMVPKHSAIAEVDGVLNCVALDGDFVGDVTLVGPGAGAGPTASSVASDIVDIARGHIFPPFVTPAKKLKAYDPVRMRSHRGGYYVRLSVFDRPGAFAAIATRMADNEISLESIMQHRARDTLPGLGEARTGDAPKPVVIVTHPTTEDAIRSALDAIEADGHVDARPRMIRIERL